MMQKPSRALLAALLVTAVVQSIAAIDVKVDADKSFNFIGIRTWAWNANQAGHILLARTPEDDPDVVRARAEPIIKSTLTAELGKRGITEAPDGTAADLVANYYMLISYGASAQYIGQFVPPNWGLPPIQASTQSLTINEQGSLVLDFSSKDEVVWRGVASAELKPGMNQEKRQLILEQAIRDTLKKFPKTTK
jgi:hypothetical protein